MQKATDERHETGVGRNGLASVVGIVAVGLSLFHLYAASPFFPPPNLFFLRSIHLTLVLVLVFLLFPVAGSRSSRGTIGWCVDGLLLCGAVYSGVYLLYFLDEVLARAGFWLARDIVAGVVCLVTLLEASRRVVGVAMTAVAGAFLAYAYLGPYLPGILQHRGYSTERLVAQLYLGQEGIFGIPLGVAATVVFIFILFGAFLEVTGGGRFFIDFAYSLAGRWRGGAAKVSVVTSALMGSLSGSAIANVVTTGSFTIPLMKKTGYRPHEAGGIEAAASTGGQIMPPIMGAGAFLIAEFTGVSYLQIVKVSIVPALLYFLTVFIFVDRMAAKRGLAGMPPSQLPSLRETMLSGWHFTFAIGVLILFLLLNVSPSLVGFFAIMSLLLVTAIRKGWFGGRQGGGMRELTRTAASRLLVALEEGAKRTLMVSTACAVAGIVVGVVGLTGLGLKFSTLVIGFSLGNLLLAMLFVALVSLVLGMGLPATASYVVLISLVGPALSEEFGVSLLIAHLVVFWYSQDSNVTPPIALAAFAAAAVAGARPVRTGLSAWKFAKGLYLVPIVMVTHPEIILGGSVTTILWIILTCLLGLSALAVAMEAFLFARLQVSIRLLLASGGVALLWPNIYAKLTGIVLVAAIAAIDFYFARSGIAPIPLQTADERQIGSTRQEGTQGE